MNIDILMATYNGEKYIENQILSLQQQTHKNWILYIRDDGSTDSTLEILENFSKSDNRIKIIKDSLGCNLGAGKNFIALTKYSLSEYVIFCDQDDIWFEKKLELLLKFMLEKSKEYIPTLVYCDGYGYSENEGIITIPSISTYHAKNLNQFLFFNAGYQGCSVMFNKELNNVCSNYKADYFYMHDDVVSLIAHTFGEVYFLPKKLMLYRQHSKNVTGNIDITFKGFLKRVFNTKSFVLSKKHYDEKLSFYEAYKDMIEDKDKKLFESYMVFPKRNLLSRLVIIIMNNFSLGGNKLSLIVKTILRKPMQ